MNEAHIFKAVFVTFTGNSSVRYTRTAENIHINGKRYCDTIQCTAWMGDLLCYLMCSELL